MYNFVHQLIELRKSHENQLAPATYDTAPLKWMNESGTEGPNWHTRHLAQYYWDSSTGTPLYIIYNFESVDQDFVLPANGPAHWNLLLDTQAAYDANNYFAAQGISPTLSANAFMDALYSAHPVSGHYTAKPSSVVVLEAAP